MSSVKNIFVALFGVIFIVEFVMAGDAVAPEEKKRIIETCLKKVPLSPEELKLMPEEKIFKEANISENLKCFVACFHKEAGLIDDKGAHNEQAVLKFLQTVYNDKKDKVPAAITKCKGELNPNDTTCNKSYQFEICIRKTMD